MFFLQFSRCLWQIYNIQAALPYRNEHQLIIRDNLIYFAKYAKALRKFYECQTVKPKLFLNYSINKAWLLYY